MTMTDYLLIAWFVSLCIFVGLCLILLYTKIRTVGTNKAQWVSANPKPARMGRGRNGGVK
jgi:hypothetical protein